MGCSASGAYALSISKHYTVGVNEIPVKNGGKNSGELVYDSELSGERASKLDGSEPFRGSKTSWTFASNASVSSCASTSLSGVREEWRRDSSMSSCDGDTISPLPSFLKRSCHEASSSLPLPDLSSSDAKARESCFRPSYRWRSLSTGEVDTLHRRHFSMERLYVEELYDGVFQSEDYLDGIRERFMESMPMEHVLLGKIECMTRPELFQNFLSRVRMDVNSKDRNKCLVMTFHGTSKENVAQIHETGLRQEASIIGAYGKGAYVGTFAGVAHQYATPTTDRGTHHMFVVLVALGEVAVGKGKKGMETHKTMTDRIDNPTQYCLVDDDRLFVTHLITYRVKPVERKRRGGGFVDPFQAALERAIMRTAYAHQNVKKTQSRRSSIMLSNLRCKFVASCKKKLSMLVPKDTE